MSNLSLTKNGGDFLKVATATPDFNNLLLEGIPDNHAGPTIVKKDYIQNTIMAQPGVSTFIVVPPCGGTPYFLAATPLGQYPGPEHALRQIGLGGQPVITYDSSGNPTAIMSQDANPYPDAADLFLGANTSSATVGPTLLNTTQLSSARCMALAAELVCLNNSFTQFGSITAYRTPMKCHFYPRGAMSGDITPAPSASSSPTIGGTITGTNIIFDPSTNANAYVTAVRDGAYTVSMNREAEFTFSDVHDGIGNDSLFWSSTKTAALTPSEEKDYTMVGAPVDPSGNVGAIRWRGFIPFWDNDYDTIVFRIDVPKAESAGLNSPVAQQFILKTWKAWEMQPVFNHLLYSFAHSSPPHDHLPLMHTNFWSKPFPLPCLPPTIPTSGKHC